MKDVVHSSLTATSKFCNLVCVLTHCNFPHHDSDLLMHFLGHVRFFGCHRLGVNVKMVERGEGTLKTLKGKNANT